MGDVVTAIVSVNYLSKLKYSLSIKFRVLLIVLDWQIFAGGDQDRTRSAASRKVARCCNRRGLTGSVSSHGGIVCSQVSIVCDGLLTPLFLRVMSHVVLYR